jgi:hypothetical protein
VPSGPVALLDPEPLILLPLVLVPPMLLTELPPAGLPGARRCSGVGGTADGLLDAGDAAAAPDGNDPDGNDPDGEGPDGEGPDGEGPDGEGPDDEGPEDEGPDDEGPDGEGPAEEGPEADGGVVRGVSPGRSAVSRPLVSTSDCTPGSCPLLRCRAAQRLSTTSSADWEAGAGAGCRHGGGSVPVDSPVAPGYAAPVGVAAGAGG